MAERCAGPDCDRELRTGGARRRFCSPLCRQRAHRDGVRSGLVPVPRRRPPSTPGGVRSTPARIDGPARFAWVDPVYPGRGALYPEGRDTPHRALLLALAAGFPDGWALATAPDTLRELLPLCPDGCTVGAWTRQARPYRGRRRAWEPVIFVGGRLTRRNVPDSVSSRVPGGWGLPGRKPDPVVAWVCAMLGARPGDTIVEPFPGSGRGRAVVEGLGLTWATVEHVDRWLAPYVDQAATLDAEGP